MQECNFQSRSLLVPFKEFTSIEKRRTQLNVLKESAKTIVITNKENNTHVIVDNVIFNNYTTTSVRIINGHVLKSGKLDYNLQYGDLYLDLHFYADWRNDGYNLDNNDDIVWLPYIYKDFCQGFNHILNFETCKQMTSIKGRPINIVDSYLFLETQDGFYTPPRFDTVDEMMRACYGVSIKK
jgi:hypothetical protein